MSMPQAHELETKLAARRRKPIGISQIDWSEYRPREYPLLASSQLDPKVIRHLLRCYAHRLTPAQARKATGLSHVTVYRTHGHIRRRLSFLQVYPSKKDFAELRDEGEEEGLAYLNWTELNTYLKSELAKRRGIRNVDRPLHEAELLQRFRDHYPPAKLYQVILESVRVAGPLNRTPGPEHYNGVLQFVLNQMNVDRRLYSQKSDNPVLHPPSEVPEDLRRSKSRPR